MPWTILLIEDDDDQSEPLVQMLRYRGHRVIPVANGPDGLARAVRDLPDLVIVDLLLFQKGDDMDGYEVIRRLRDTPQTADVGILAWTGHFVEQQDQIRALRSGADDYITKNIEFGVFEARMEALLRRARRGRGE